MMVTFVSQCEKKSLAKTRRVLDAFANRIGSNTWQTVITNEGLQAVKTLLRNTASKNTAVSCHWIRSRSRSELVWIVGNRSKFNAQGIVPVNYTTQENILKMDGIEVNIKQYYANTKKQPLDQHLFAVGYVAYRIIQQFVDDDKLAKAVFVGGCLHDVGKIDPAFQAWVLDKTKKVLSEDLDEEGQHIDKIGKFSFESHPRHNEISLLLYHLLDNAQDKRINRPNKDRIKHVLYWHHAKPIRKEEFRKLDVVYKKLKKNIGNSDLSMFADVFTQVIAGVNAVSKEYFSESTLLLEGFLDRPDKDKLYELDDTQLPHYKRYSQGNDGIDDYLDNIKENAKNNLARTAVVTADRLVSALSYETLNQHIEEATLDTLFETALLEDRGLKREIQGCLDGFNQRFPDSERNKKQAKAALSLSVSEEDQSAVKVLNGPAGCGKTKVALEWAANTNARKIIWVCPRIQVCQGLVNDLTSSDYLPNVKIELCTGEFKTIYQAGQEAETPEGEEFSGDIILTTIDQLINTITTHSRVTGLVQYMNAHVVFDEYHEYIHMPAFNLLFAELVECKKLQQEKANALLVSATPNYFFVEEFLGIEKEDIIGIDSFNQRQYKIQFSNFDEAKQGDTNPLYQSQPANTFVISNTATTAQLSFIKNQHSENAILIHSKFKKIDKQSIFNQVFDSFKRNGNRQYDVLRAGPIVQASLNITCDKMITEFTHAENWLQRLGRLDRFGENDEVNVYITAVPESIAETGKQKGSCSRFLNSMNCFQSAKAWREFLLNKEVEDKPLTLAEIYQLYESFYDDEKSREAIEQDLIAALKTSVMVINNKVIDPISFPKKKKVSDGKVKIKKSSLRGDNRFVQMAVCQINEQGQCDIINDYAYEDSDWQASLTSSVEQICGYGDSKQNLLSFMVKKHHNIKGGAKSYKDSFTLNEARSHESPIYLSYTPDDLNLVGSEPHSCAVYYAIGVKQIIGAIPMNKLEQYKGEET
ncbi:MAG: CRISPR-associated endonuclease Cas3'' [Mariprofundaceae bacterium]|nr:CRISPR-associated endonuclease Cas3'' [Mariprofundaceae bacterium]